MVSRYRYSRWDGTQEVFPHQSAASVSLGAVSNP